MKPHQRPRNPRFSSGPCPKRPGWNAAALDTSLLGRSHRSNPGKAALKRAIDQSREILGVPDDYRIAIVPASDTGAVEMALWNLLGPRPVDILAWESFGRGWWTDISSELNLDGARLIAAPYGELPDLSLIDPDHDLVFTWNGTTSGVKAPDGGGFIADGRGGLTICDATSAAFAMDLPWSKLDVTTYSWQKILGGEAAHGMLILSPRAVERLRSYTPPWPLPKIFRLKKGGEVIEGVFEGETINTPSMLAVADYLDALAWVETIGGLDGAIARTQANFDTIGGWVAECDWINFLAKDPAVRSPTSVCLEIVDPWTAGLTEEEQRAVVKALTVRLAEEEAAFDVGGYRAAPPGLRIWAGATVESQDLELLFPWLDWAFAAVKSEMAEKV